MTEFSPGSTTATMMIVDVATKTVVCQGSLAAASTPTFVPQGGADQLMLDLRRNFETALAALETRLARAPLR